MLLPWLPADLHEYFHLFVIRWLPVLDDDNILWLVGLLSDHRWSASERLAAGREPSWSSRLVVIAVCSTATDLANKTRKRCCSPSTSWDIVNKRVFYCCGHMSCTCNTVHCCWRVTLHLLSAGSTRRSGPTRSGTSSEPCSTTSTQSTKSCTQRCRRPSRSLTRWMAWCAPCPRTPPARWWLVTRVSCTSQNNTATTWFS